MVEHTYAKDFCGIVSTALVKRYGRDFLDLVQGALEPQECLVLARVTTIHSLFASLSTYNLNEERLVSFH